ncbi:hypothetical protein EYZ11_000175 [Aspergillus tanneri]|uniref:Uncharacterized protein n=1 Tax=Aspergillus tanneri TaxID=1220188 RepID=A0A4S3JXK9_9EURO|nr:hypothetical protein EYZ11_000175 [Aspergillus tanneri]
MAHQGLRYDSLARVRAGAACQVHTDKMKSVTSGKQMVRLSLWPGLCEDTEGGKQGFEPKLVWGVEPTGT